MNREGLQGFFRKDVSTMCILAVLDNTEELYGYELMQRLQQDTEGLLVMPEGTLYPILYRLEAQGFVVAEKRQIGKRLQRVYYRITQAGRLYYRQMRKAYADVINGVQNLLSIYEQGDEA